MKRLDDLRKLAAKTRRLRATGDVVTIKAYEKNLLRAVLFLEKGESGAERKHLDEASRAMLEPFYRGEGALADIVERFVSGHRDGVRGRERKRRADETYLSGNRLGRVWRQQGGR